MEATNADRLTIGEIRREEFPDIPLHRLKYAVETYNIQPVGRAGILRLFSRQQVPRIRSALARIASRQGGANA